MKNVTYPITNDLIIDLADKQLAIHSPAYQIIFRILLETGMPLSTCVELRCCDIDKNSITFHPTHKSITRTEPLSPGTQKLIADYLNGRNDETLAFPQLRNPNKPLHPRNFLSALESISDKYNIRPVITSQSIRKTYIYRLFKDDNRGNKEKLFKITGLDSMARLYDYLGLPNPEDSSKEHLASGMGLKDLILQEKLIPQTKQLTTEVLNDVEDKVSYTTVQSFEYYSAVMTLMQSLNEAITIFKDSTKTK